MKFSINSYDAYSTNYSIHNASQLLYRFGYIANVGIAPEPRDDIRAALSKWINTRVGTLHFLLHPETLITQSVSAKTQIAIIGHVFDAIHGELSAQKITDKLAAHESANTSFLNFLDNLAGRYLVFANFGTGWTVYPDAFGSKMRYFAPDVLGTVASHATLIANVCGLPLNFDIQGFINSESYRKRDVKVLPGLATDYEGLYVAPANHSLELTRMGMERFWPRGNLTHNDTALAEETFIKYLDNYSDYILRTFDTDVFGLTGGMDSRTMLAPLIAKGVNLQTFTLLRGDAANRQDMETAKTLASKFNFPHTPINVSTEASRTTGYFEPSRKALRMNGGPQRLNTIYSNDSFYKEFKGKLSSNCSFSRGFGGEIIRGFYRKTSGPLKEATAARFAQMNGVLSEQEIVKIYFQHFIDNLDYNMCYDADLFDIFYMEHRMSKWAASSLSETDLTAFSIVGMSCRKLYEVNMGLPFEYRKSREVFKKTVMQFCPKLLDIDIC